MKIQGALYGPDHIPAREGTFGDASEDAQRSYPCGGTAHAPRVIWIDTAWGDVQQLSVREQ